LPKFTQRATQIVITQEPTAGKSPKSKATCFSDSSTTCGLWLPDTGGSSHR
jgi:hypothetical protein